MSEKRIWRSEKSLTGYLRSLEHPVIKWGRAEEGYMQEIYRSTAKCLATSSWKEEWDMELKDLKTKWNSLAPLNLRPQLETITSASQISCKYLFWPPLTQKGILGNVNQVDDKTNQHGSTLVNSYTHLLIIFSFWMMILQKSCST